MPWQSVAAAAQAVYADERPEWVRMDVAIPLVNCLTAPLNSRATIPSLKSP